MRDQTPYQVKKQNHRVELENRVSLGRIEEVTNLGCGLSFFSFQPYHESESKRQAGK